MKCDICSRYSVGVVTIAQTKTNISICSDCTRYVTDLTYQTGVCIVPAGTFDLEDWIQKNPYTDISSASKEFQSAVNIYS